MDCFVAEPVIGPAERPDPLAPRNDGKCRHAFAFSRREAPEFYKILRLEKQRA
jgi:hypothetical protein